MLRKYATSVQASAVPVRSSAIVVSAPKGTSISSLAVEIEVDVPASIKAINSFWRSGGTPRKTVSTVAPCRRRESNSAASKAHCCVSKHSSSACSSLWTGDGSCSKPCSVSFSCLSVFNTREILARVLTFLRMRSRASSSTLWDSVLSSACSWSAADDCATSKHCSLLFFSPDVCRELKDLLPWTGFSSVPLATSFDLEDSNKLYN
mmetsp:Transcript_23375/g.42640  ORF Transcript_23375/g.42640 Transcript_23375/m.42640 type:complete len:206 (+) Transcript_23375:3140-3757(+)